MTFSEFVPIWRFAIKGDDVGQIGLLKVESKMWVGAEPLAQAQGGIGQFGVIKGLEP